ncbi:DMT family transporter [Pendulispora rubella]|uniref:DMT family transporter n=1 Tax=Pendulispora rubella TaxID=2741070 RepID=A0ABZ2KX87_9BACT
MLGYILLGVFNGAVIAASRAISGRLAIDLGAFKASFWNHIVGFVFLSVVMLTIASMKFEIPMNAPALAYMGGIFGALFVALNSYVLPRIGVTKTMLFVIGGQMIAGVLLDVRNSKSAGAAVAQFVGVGLILLGVYVARTSKKE